jgi:GntR family transcriptional regulator of arabinose operon
MSKSRGPAPGRSTPLYRQVRDAIAREIEEKNLAPNSAYLSESRVMERFGVSRVTARQAFQLLEREGYLYRVQGKGTFIAPHDVKPAKTVALLATCVLQNGVDAVMLRAIEDYLNAYDINLVVCNCDNSLAKAERYVKRLITSGIDGLIYMAVPSDGTYGKNAELMRFVINHGVPVVQLDRYSPELEGMVASVRPDNERGGYLLTRHLVDIGHRRIGFCGTYHSTAVADRFAGYRRCLDEHGIAFRPEYHKRTLCLEDFPVVAAQFAMMKDPPTAVFALSDDPAYRLIDALRRHSIRVPEDIAVVGFDDYTMIPDPTVELTTVRVPLREEGRIAASVLVNLLDKEDEGPRSLRVPVELVVRRSCGAGLPAGQRSAAAS